MVYNTLNRLKWTGRLPECRVVILHRGAPKDEKSILGRDITEIKKSHFLYREEGIQKGGHARREEGPQGVAVARQQQTSPSGDGKGKAPEEETYIPLHRVLRIMEGGKTVWERKQRKP